MSIADQAPVQGRAHSSDRGAAWDAGQPEQDAVRGEELASTVVGLRAFIVDGSLIMLLTESERRIWPSELLLAFRATSVREPEPAELLLGAWLGNRQARVYVDPELLAHERVAYREAPPVGLTSVNTEQLCSTLGAQPMVLLARDRSAREVHAGPRAVSAVSHRAECGPGLSRQLAGRESPLHASDAEAL